MHEGHLALIRQGARLGGPVVVSIYVNPTQFAPHEDFAAYPRQVQQDLDAALAAPGGCFFVSKRNAKSMKKWFVKGIAKIGAYAGDPANALNDKYLDGKGGAMVVFGIKGGSGRGCALRGEGLLLMQQARRFFEKSTSLLQQRLRRRAPR